MGLKQDIVIVNEYTVPLPSSSGKKGGSRGATPGDYVTRYMARDLATETIAPIRGLSTDSFITRYMARAEATESLDVTSARALKRRMGKAQGAGGVAFGYGEVSLSDEQLRFAARDIQRLFDSGKTVMKTVLSFDEEYLRRHGIISPDFVHERAGDYRGHIDQMKLRLAVMHGLSRMNAALYDDLRYCAVAQVDTDHVHVHLAMVDAGPGTLAADGTQKGKINERAKSLLRRGMDAWLDEKQTVKHLASAVGYERRNVTTFVKRWAHQQMLREQLPQFLLACLPEDRRLWRSSTNHEAMRKPNRIVHQLVEEVLEREGSPMGSAMADVHAYAAHRREAEGLSQEQRLRLVEQGRAQIVERGVNAVYGLLRGLPEDALRVRTPMLDAMGMDYEEVARRAAQPSAQSGTEEDLVGFAFRLRSYSTRLDEHRSLREEYHAKAREWEAADEAGLAVPESASLHRFYLEEEEYQAKCAAKYQKFLAFAPPSATWHDEWKDVAEYGERLLSLESMRRDASLRKLKDPDEAERVGREVYGQAGGHLVSQNTAASKQRLEERVARMRVEYVRRVSDLRVVLASKGLRLDLVQDPATGREEAEITAVPEHPFDEVKGLDLHRLRYDFSTDVEVGAPSLSSFLTAARSRRASLEAALAYLEASGQGAAAADLPVRDVREMGRLADSLAVSPRGTSVLPSEVAKLAREQERLRRSRTVRLDEGLSRRLQEQVDAAAAFVEPQAEREAPDADAGAEPLGGEQRG